MIFTDYLREQLIDFVEVYRKYYKKTIWITTLFSILLLIIFALLIKIGPFGEKGTTININLINLLFQKFSIGDTYNIVDISKSVFIFFISVFSIGITRYQSDDKDINEYKFLKFINNIELRDIIYLFGTLILCLIIDYTVVKIDSTLIGTKNSLFNWFNVLLMFFVRDYFPFLLFSITIYILISDRKEFFNVRYILYLLVAVWIMNVFASALFLYVNAFVFQLILSPTRPEDKNIYVSILGLVIVGFYFLGYYSALTKSYVILNYKD